MVNRFTPLICLKLAPWLIHFKARSGFTTLVPETYNSMTWYMQGGTVTASHDRDIYEGITRTRCAFHIGNVSDDVSGCIAIGLDVGALHSKWAVLHSKVAMGELLDYIGAGDHTLTITHRPCG